MASSVQDTLIRILSTDSELTDFVSGLIKGEGYHLELSPTENSFLAAVTQDEHDLLLVDFDEDIPAIELCKKIRANFSLRHLPIIILVEKEHTIDKIKAIYAGADDYVEKPIQAGDILTRIKANLWRASRDLDANPLTKLPGNVSILKELERRIRNKETFCMGYADLNKFKEYNDYYGFEYGDRVIKHTAKILAQALYDFGTPDDFLGHIGGDDYIFITGWSNLKNVCESVISSFDKSVPQFYAEEDIQKGYIVVKNRVGKLTSIPLLSISLGVATNKNRDLSHVGQVIQIATELKSYAKTFSKSIYVIDKRQLEPDL